MSERSRNTTTKPDTVRAAGPAPDAAQLRLLPGRQRHAEWELDDRTRRVGLRGVAEAREILRQARRPEPIGHARKAS